MAWEHPVVPQSMMMSKTLQVIRSSKTESAASPTSDHPKLLRKVGKIKIEVRHFSLSCEEMGSRIAQEQAIVDLFSFITETLRKTTLQQSTIYSTARR